LAKKSFTFTFFLQLAENILLKTKKVSKINSTFSEEYFLCKLFVDKFVVYFFTFLISREVKNHKQKVGEKFI
jgi:hypothetical protein